MTSNTLSDAGAKLMNRAHRLILTLSGNRLLAKPFGMALVELHTTGRKSGLPRSCYLTSPVHNSGQVVLVASKGGDDAGSDNGSTLTAIRAVGLPRSGENRNDSRWGRWSLTLTVNPTAPPRWAKYEVGV